MLHKGRVFFSSSSIVWSASDMTVQRKGFLFKCKFADIIVKFTEMGNIYYELPVKIPLAVGTYFRKTHFFLMDFFHSTVNLNMSFHFWYWDEERKNLGNKTNLLKKFNILKKKLLFLSIHENNKYWMEPFTCSWSILGMTLRSNHNRRHRMSILMTEVSIAPFCRSKTDHYGRNPLQLHLPELPWETNLWS